MPGTRARRPAATSFEFDLFVIGGGSAGVRAARTAAARGARVALAECADFGGTCVNVGCVPKKLYSYAAGYAEAFEEAPGFGWHLGAAPRFDWQRLKARRAQEIRRLNGVYLGLLEGAGVHLLDGWAQLAGAHQVVVNGRSHSSRRILVATGGRPRRPAIPGAEHAMVSDDMFDLPRFPRRLLVVGGGYIACEFASIFRGLGAEVTLLLRGAHMLAGFDDDASHFLAREMGRNGIDVRLNTAVESIVRHKGTLTAMLTRGQQIQADTVLYAIGRMPLTDGLGLETAGVACNADGAIEVDAHYRSSVASVYAIGDVCTRVPLTPVALAEATQVVDRLFGDGRRPPLDYEQVPTAVFTHPPVGRCGLTEAQARARLGPGGLQVFCTEFKPLRHTLSERGERSFMKLVVDRKTDRVVGLHMVGADAPEIVQGFAVAMTAGATKAQFDRTLGIHPTSAEELVTLREPMPG